MASPIEGLKNAHLIDKERALYSPPRDGPFKCGLCEYWIPSGACKLVAGKIEYEGCCALFEKPDQDEDD